MKIFVFWCCCRLELVFFLCFEVLFMLCFVFFFVLFSVMLCWFLFVCNIGSLVFLVGMAFILYMVVFFFWVGFYWVFSCLNISDASRQPPPTPPFF